MGKQNAFAQQTLIPCCELDFGNGERVSEVKRPVHVRVGEVSKPLWKLFVDLCASEACGFLSRWGISFKDAPLFPVILILLFQGLQVVPLASLAIERIISDRADDAKGGEAPGQVRGCLTYVWRRTVLMVQIFYNSSGSGTRGAKVRVLCQMKRVVDTDQSFAPSQRRVMFSPLHNKQLFPFSG
jgi:hypothetical protein